MCESALLREQQHLVLGLQSSSRTKLSVSRHDAAVSPCEIFVLRVGKAVSAAEHCMSIAKVVDVDVTAENM